MSTFICVNQDCDAYGIEIPVGKVRWIWSKEEQRLVQQNAVVCELCGESMEYVEQEGVPDIRINKFKSLSSQERRAIIHKRAIDHFNKTDKGDLANLKKNMIENVKRQATGRL
jgi:hypothetical protein